MTPKIIKARRTGVRIYPGGLVELSAGPAEPAATAEILIAAYEQLGLRPDETRDILQDLYEGNRKAVMAAEPDREQSDG